MELPMMCLVDFRGFRLMAEAVMPLDVKKYDQYGTELSSSEKIVMGTKEDDITKDILELVNQKIKNIKLD